MNNKQLQKTIKTLIKVLEKDYISDNHRHLGTDFNWDCPECKFILLESGLKWWLELLKIK